MGIRAVFLDRDGVLNNTLISNRKPKAPLLFEDFTLRSEVPTALKKLQNLGFLNVVVTNQPDIASGELPPSELAKMNDYLMKSLPIAGIYCCTHSELDQCKCRKPKTGLVEKAAVDYNISISQSYMVGDRWRDIECGQNAKVKESFFLDNNYDEKRPIGSFVTVCSLIDMINHIKLID